MYILSPALLEDIRRTAAVIERELPVRFEEYIAIPSFGTNIILRFDYTGEESLDLDALDVLESRLRQCTGGKYMANVMGSVCQQCGLDLSHLNEILCSMDRHPVAAGVENLHHREGLTEDIRLIRECFGLDDGIRLWEIQVENDHLLVLALIPESGAPFKTRFSKIDGMDVQLLFIKDDGSFSGLMKAVTLASEKKVSLCRILLAEQDVH